MAQLIQCVRASLFGRCLWWLVFCFCCFWFGFCFFVGAIVIQIYRDNLNWIDVVSYINQTNVKKYDMWKINIIKTTPKKKERKSTHHFSFHISHEQMARFIVKFNRLWGFFIVKIKPCDDFYSLSSTNKHIFHPATWHCKSCLET